MSFSYAKFIARRGGVVLASGPPTIQNGGSIAKQPIKLSKLKKSCIVENGFICKTAQLTSIK